MSSFLSWVASMRLLLSPESEIDEWEGVRVTGWLVKAAGGESSKTKDRLKPDAGWEACIRGVLCRLLNAALFLKRLIIESKMVDGGRSERTGLLTPAGSLLLRESGSNDDPSTGRDPFPVSPLGPRRGNESLLTYCTDGASALRVRRWTLSLRHPTPQTNLRACQSSPSCPTRSCSKSSGTPPSCTRTESNDRLRSGGWSRTSGWLAGDCGTVRPSRLNHPLLLPPLRLTQSRLIFSLFGFSDPVVSSLDDLPFLLDQRPPAVPLVLLSSATFQLLLLVPPSSDVFLRPLGTQRARGARSVCRLSCVEPCGRGRERVDVGRRGRLEE